MKIAGIDAQVFRADFRRPFVVWRGPVSSKEHVFVRIETDSGFVGWGEAAPFLSYAPETAEDVVSMIMNHLGPDLIGQDPREIRSIANQFAVVDGHEFAKCAIEMALWDILGQSLGVPVYRLLGGGVRQSVPIVIVLQTNDAETMADEAREWVGRGFVRLKIKVGFGLDEDENAVAHVREAVGASPLIRVDAEEHYSQKEALDLCQRLAPHRVELISQPVPRTDWDGMNSVRRQASIPVLADEGIHSPVDVLHCVRAKAADMVNIKVLKCGGLLPSLDMAAIAQAAHMPIVVGSMVETGLGSLFGAHFALAAPGAFSSELCGPLLYKDSFLDRELDIRDGRLFLDERPGLGAAFAVDRV